MNDSDAKRMEELARRLREAEERAETAERERQDERQRADAAERARQDERQRADAAERERQDERQRADREQQRADASEQQTRLTTLDEYIAACHTLVFSKFTVESNPKLTSKGPITNPRNKWCPTTLRPWSDFLQQQRITFGKLYDTFPVDSRVFENHNFLAVLGGRMSSRTIADEKTLEYFLHNSVEEPVKGIINQLKKVQDVKSAFNLGDGVVFENHPHAISDLSEEVLDRNIPSPPSTPEHRFNLNQLRPDQICVYRQGLMRRTMIFVSEYKPPHKLIAPYLRLGLHPMNIYKDVVNRKTVPTSVDADARFQYFAEKLTAAAITQTYHYMVEGGLEYGLLTTGEAIVFLKIDWREPESLLYHLAEPDAEVLAHSNHVQSCAAVGQYLAFSLMALGEGRLHGQDERNQVMEKLETWKEDFETTLRSVPEDERNAPPSSPGYQPEVHEGIDRSPYLLRGKRRQRVGDEPVKEQVQRDLEDSSDDASGFPDTPSPTERRIRRGGSRGSGSQGGRGTRRSERILAQRPKGAEGQAERGAEGSSESYCTQKCLLGLVGDDLLDPSCPNVSLHGGRLCKHGNSRGAIPALGRHAINHARFLALLGEQLKQTLDRGITPLAQGGARGVLFKVTLLAHGYTFVGKGTVEAFIKDLQHEAAVYARLRPIQGSHVPVFLGAIDLRPLKRTYYYDHRVYVIHMTFLSWGGQGLISGGPGCGGDRQLEDKAWRSLRAVHGQGVIHDDVRIENLLFNAEINGVMMIDFERALLLEPPRHPLAQLVPNKRKRASETNMTKLPTKAINRSQSGGSFSEDVMTMNTLFGAYLISKP